MIEDPIQADALNAFRAAYGRICVLVASGLYRGHNVKRILNASRGHGEDVAPVYTDLRRQRYLVNKTLNRCKEVSIDNSVIVDSAREIRTAIEAEYMCRIPMMA